MIEKMAFVNMMGPKNELNRAIKDFMYPYDFHVESAINELKNAENISSFDDENIYEETLANAKKFYELLEVKGDEKTALAPDDAIYYLDDLAEKHEKTLSKLKVIEDKIKEKEELYEKIKPFSKLDFDFEELLALEYLYFSFGRMPLLNYEQVKTRLNTDESIFLRAYSDKDYIYVLYFTSENLREKISVILSSIHFEAIYMPENLTASPNEILDSLKYEIESLKDEMKLYDKELNESLELAKDKISSVYSTIEKLYLSYEMRKYAAKTEDDFFILVGWMAESDANKLEKEIVGDESLFFIIEEENSDLVSSPPTKLSNKKLFRPFEFFIDMYGLPSHNEIDPTAIFAITYTILFGIMFADIGQGLVISLLGFLFYKTKKHPMGAIISTIGISSTFFGVLFGSFFGYEIKPLWFAPMELINPQFNIYQILVIAIVIGIFIILFTMLVQIFNAKKRGDIGEMFFGTNGVAGFVFYLAILLVLLSNMLDTIKIPKIVSMLMIVIPLLVMAAKEPLTNLIKHKQKLISRPLSTYILEVFFELFEVLLSYMANTVSFVRVGAFVLSHAGMMSVVIMLSEGKGLFSKILISIIGNIVVIAFEGLIVGIQVLRLEYYEMFSRFYQGTGRKFESFKNNTSVK